MKGPHAFVEHLTGNLYHPRSDAHSNALCRAIIVDLLEHCPPFAAKAGRGEIVAKLNHSVTINYQTWNFDLAVGPPPGTPIPAAAEPIRFETPATVELAIEAKGVMTEHGKARYNRLRDLQAFHQHVHIYNPKAIAVGVVVVNVADVYWSPTRPAHDITRHQRIDRVGPETVNVYRNLPQRHSPTNGPGLEAAAVLVVRHDNLAKNPALPPDAPAPQPTSLVTKPPAPQVGDPLHYATMIQRICAAYRERWA